MNYRAVWSLYQFEMARFADTVIQSLLAPVISTSLYFIVFGSAIGSKMTNVEGVGYGAFLVPGLTMLSILTESITNASSEFTCRNSWARSTKSFLHRSHRLKSYWGTSALPSPNPPFWARSS